MTQQTYYRCRKQYAGMNREQMKKMSEADKEMELRANELDLAEKILASEIELPQAAMWVARAAR